jgi:hypothetical protein
MGGPECWDGGLAGRPTITSPVREAEGNDTLLAQVKPRPHARACDHPRRVAHDSLGAHAHVGSQRQRVVMQRDADSAG